ncbi:MAG: poly-gamma-glutamate biosynthesis protein PgsC [Hyphomicrobiales bacterium]
MLLTEAIAIGLVLGFFCYEWIGLSAGGFVVPGYLALYWDRPWMVATTLALAFIVHRAVEGIGRVAIVYGRRRFMLSLLAGFAGQWLLETVTLRTGMLPMEMDAIGYIIPGLIANEMSRQRVVPTVCMLVALSVTVRLMLIVLGQLRS